MFTIQRLYQYTLALLLVVIFLPVVSSSNHHNPRKGVALAYGWHNGEGGADKLQTGTYMFWWLTPPIYSPRSGRYLPTFWSDCPAYAPTCFYEESIWPDYEEFVEYSANMARRYVVVDGRIAVIFANECDLPWPQCQQTPGHMAQVYLRAADGCPHCVFFGPATSSKDRNCDWPDEQHLPFHDEIKYHGQWCYWQEFWKQVELIAAQNGMDVPKVMEGKQYCAVHHYQFHPALGFAGDEYTRDTLDSLWGLGCRRFIIAEYSACDPAIMAAMTDSYDKDERVVAFYAWTANLPDTPQGTPCEVLLDWNTGELTSLGEAFAASGNGR